MAVVYIIMAVVYITEKILNESTKLQTKEILDYCICGCKNIRVSLENTLFIEKEISIPANPSQIITINGIITKDGFINLGNRKGEIGKVTKIESIDDLKNITKKENE